MKVRWFRRRKAAMGIALAEALVSLTIAAMTLALLTSATWGLRQTTIRPSIYVQEATDWLTARRVVQSWAASATLAGRDMAEGRFSGTPIQMRIILDDGSSRDGKPMMISLDVVEEDELFRLTASRYFDVRDIRLATESVRASTVIVTDQPLRLVYRMASQISAGARVWTYEPRPEQGLPTAIAIEQGAERMIVAQMPATISAFCVSRLGEAALGSGDCNLR